MPSSAPPTDAHHRLLAPAPGSVLAEFTSGRRLSCWASAAETGAIQTWVADTTALRRGLSNAGLENFSKHERDY